MDLFTLLFVYIVMVAAAIFLLLFGEAPMFMGTPIAKLHWLLFHGVCQGVWHLTDRLGGARGTQSLHALTEACCNSSNPALQLFYIALLGIGYFFYCRDLFCFLPQPYAPVWHQYTGALALGLCLATFGAACASDPGEITPDNLAAHMALYPYDGLTSHAGQQCWTCLWQRPARSKHCSVCNRCVARFDHHCAWINNCVGALNLRHFLAFLAANVLLTSYGVCLGCVIMRGVLDRRNAWGIAFRDSSSGQIRRLGSSPRMFMRWLLQMYPIQVALLMFMAVGLLLVAGFLAYQLVLVGSGTTTYETYKWREVARRMAVERWASGEGTSETASKDGPGSGRRGWLLPWRGRSSPQPRQLVMPENVYNRGLHANFVDALFPPLAWARQRHGASGSVRKRE